MLTAHGHQSQVRDALQAGAAGYLLKDTPADEVVRAVQAVHAGVTLPARPAEHTPSTGFG
jgi:DNA-binding NarL/FixJ family response regulator